MSEEKRRILIHLDGDAQPSVFDRVVAIDAGVDELLSYGNVKPEQVRDLVHGAIFTRGPKDLARTAIFIGGTDVAKAEGLLAEACKHMLPQFGLRVSILLDANGANTTAAAAVHAAAKHLNLSETAALVLGGTGPVGQRVARLLAGSNARVTLASRQLSRAEAVRQAIVARVPAAAIEPLAITTALDLASALQNKTLVVACGAAGVVLLPQAVREAATSLKVVIDLNAVPPPGIEGVEITDRGAARQNVVAYGALGIGGTKMKIHKAAIRKLFERNDQILDAEEAYAIAKELDGGG
jgi:hypothetical protein